MLPLPSIDMESPPAIPITSGDLKYNASLSSGILSLPSVTSYFCFVANLPYKMRRNSNISVSEIFNNVVSPTFGLI